MWDRFVQERVYLKGISPATVRYYKNVHSAFQTILPEPTQAGLVECIKTLRERGVKASSVNTWLRGLKAYQLWRKEQGYEVFKVQFLKTETKVLATLSQETIRVLIGARLTGTNLRRAHLVALTILDTGLRASEVLGLAKEDVDFENCVLKVKGKGKKHRLVPLSFELRKHLWKNQRLSSPAGNGPTLLFGTKNNTHLSVRNLERDFKVLGQKLGITGVRFSPHTLRHSFAVGYLRKGGNLFYLSKILGHTSVKTTERYLQSLGIEDLQKVHNGLSLLTHGGRF